MEVEEKEKEEGIMNSRINLALFGKNGLVLGADVVGDFDDCGTVGFTDDFNFLGWGFTYYLICY